MTEQEPEFINLEQIDEFCTPSKIIYKGVLKGTLQKVFVKKGLADAEINKIRYNFNVSRNIKEEAIAPIYLLFGSNQDSILMPYFDCISTEIKNEIAKKDEEPNLGYVEKIIIAYGIAYALKKSHEKKIMHLNLNPSNVLLEYKLPKITDFVNHSTFSKEELMKLPINTLLYMAPEIINNNESCFKSDVYSFGLLLNFLFTGKEPIENISNDDEVRNSLLNTKNYQISFNIDDFDEYEEIGDIISQCIVQDQDQRLSFDEILLKLEKMMSRCQKFEKYKFSLLSDSLKLPVHFKQLQIIAQLPKSENELKSFQFDFQKLLYILSEYQEKYICIVFLCGPHQTGKSTIARTLTGNQAFYMGDGLKGTTKNILMDTHGYTVQELRSRLSNRLYKLFDAEISQIKTQEPVFFFIDSVGGGDENYVQFLKTIVDRLNSILSSIATVCITINTPMNNNPETSDYLRMIRKGQMLSLHSQISDVILGLRECKQINDFIDRFTHSSYEKAMEELKKRWFDSHQMILSQYKKNSLYVMPLANPNDNSDAYMFSVSEVILRIIKTTVRRINLLPKEFNGQNFQSIVSVVSRLTYYLFYDKQYEEFSKNLKSQLKENLIDEDTKLYNSPIQGQICNFFSVLCQNIIRERIKIGETENPNEKEIKKEIEKLSEEINVIATIYLPMHLADTYIPFDEFFQLMYDIYQQSTDLIKDSLPKWTKGMSFPKIPQLTQIKKDEKICFSDVIDEGIDAAKNGASVGFTIPALLGPLGAVTGIILLFTPLSPIGATMFLVSAGVSFIGPFAGSAVGAVTFGATAMAINGIEQQSEINRKYKNKVEKQKTEHKNLLSQINYEFQKTIDKFV